MSFISNNKIIDIYTESNEDNLVLSDKNSSKYISKT